MSAISVPAQPGDVTAEWLTEVLHRSGALPADSTVAAVALESLPGAGVDDTTGEVARLRVTYAGDRGSAPASVIVKSPSRSAERRERAVDRGMYEAEVRFLRELDAQTPVRTPRVFLAEVSAGGAEFVVVMEDLGHLVMGDELEGVDLDQAADAVVAMADLHASWWGRVDTPEMAWVPSIVHPRDTELTEMWPALWLGFRSKFGESLPDGAEAAGAAIAAHYWRVIEHLARWPWTLLHQDYRVDNLFFDAANRDEPVVVIDWQGIGRGPGIYDLCHFLGGSLTVADRRRGERSLVETYLGRLESHGIEGLDADHLWHDYRFGHLACCAAVMIAGATSEIGEPRGRTLIETLASRHFQAVVDLASTALLDELDG